MATLFARIREIVTAHAHHQLDEVEDPHVMAQQLLRGLSEDILGAQRALVSALGAEKQLQRSRERRDAEAAEWESKAERLLLAGDETLARGALEKAVAARAAATALQVPLETARKSVARMREQVARLRSEWEAARSRCAQIGASQTAARAMGVAGRANDHYTAAMERAQRLDELSQKATGYEAEVEAASELLGEQDRFEREVGRADQTAAVDEAFATLKARLARAAEDKGES